MSDDMTLAELAVVFGADQSAYDRALDQVVAKAVRAGERAGSSFGGRFALGFSSPMLSAIGGIQQLVNGTRQTLGFLGVATGVQIAASYEKLTLGFKTLTGSATEAKKIMGELAQLGADTPFKTEELTSYAQRLLSLGVNAKKVTSDLSALADATAARGGSTEDLGALARIVGRFRTRQHLSIQTVGMIGGYMDLSKVVGAATGKDNLTIPQASHILSSQSGEQAYETLIAGAKKVYGGAAAGQGANTFTGLGQNLQENLALAMKPTGDALLPVIEDVEKYALSATKEVKKLNEATGGSAGLVAIVAAGVPILLRMGSSLFTATQRINSFADSIGRLATGTGASAGVGGRLNIPQAIIQMATVASMFVASAVGGMGGAGVSPSTALVRTGGAGATAAGGEAAAATSAAESAAPAAGLTIGQRVLGAGKAAGGGLLNWLPFLTTMGLGYASNRARSSGHPQRADDLQKIASGVGTGSLIGTILGGAVGAGIGFFGGGGAGAIPGFMIGARAGGLAGGAIGGLGQTLQNQAGGHSVIHSGELWRLGLVGAGTGAAIGGMVGGLPGAAIGGLIGAVSFAVGDAIKQSHSGGKVGGKAAQQDNAQALRDNTQALQAMNTSYKSIGGGRRIRRSVVEEEHRAIRLYLA